MFEINNFFTAGKFFLIISGELILIFVAVSFLVGILMEYLPPSRIRDFLSNRFTWVQYLLGSGLGAVTPFCSCSTVPITAGLLKGGVPFGPTMAFLFVSPVLNPIIIALLLSLFGLKVTVVYVVVTFLGSMILAAILSRMGMENQVKQFSPHHRRGWGKHPGIDNTRFNVQEKTRIGVCGECFRSCNCRWISGRMADILTL